MAVATTQDDIVVALAARPAAVIVDERLASSLPRITASPSRTHWILVFVTLQDSAAAPPGCDVVVPRTWLCEVLGLVQSTTHRAAIQIERLLSSSLLGGALEVAASAASAEIAGAFGVDRCAIELRSSDATHVTRRAAATAATLIASLPGTCESWLAVPLDVTQGKGHVVLHARGPRVFTREEYWALHGVATRFATELAWRSAHERTAQELDRMISGPACDRLTGVWNRAALIQLTGMCGSASRRAGQPLAVVALDVVELQAINTRLGLDVGDRLLQRICDALRSMLREEDVIGRWSGDEIAIALPITGIDGARGVVARVSAALAERTIELANDERLAIPVTYGVVVQKPDEPAELLLGRAAEAAEMAQRSAASEPAFGDTAGVAAPNVSQQLEVVREELGSVLGGTYRLLHEISRGGMGVVYRAEDLALERAVAIKMLRPDLEDDKSLFPRLRAEAAMLARLQHPNLVQVYSFGQRGGDSYLVMELVEGESLEHAFERHRAEHTCMQLSELVRVIEQVASAVDLLHERGIIHRDIKPSNVILDPFRGRAVLVDVGIAVVHGRKATVAGTPGYIAPEVVLGKDATPRSDVYGLAATAYSLLTMTHPWGNPTDAVAVITRQTLNELRAPSLARPELAPVDAILLQALNADPGTRPESAGAFAHALREGLSAIVAQTAEPLPAERPRHQRAHEVTHQTRGVVFRAVAPALGVREAARFRDALSTLDPELARTLTTAAPLDWLPAELFVRLLERAATLCGRPAQRIARDLSRATVRTSFRRFFPTSSATLVPERTLSAIRNVWGRYHSWGTISSIPVSATESGVRLEDMLGDALTCEWASGLLEQLVLLSGGVAPVVSHTSCMARGDAECLFRVVWELAPHTRTVSTSRSSSDAS